MKPFPLVVLLIFSFFLLLGFLVFAGVIPLFERSPTPQGVGGSVSVWGTFPEVYLHEAIQNLNAKNNGAYTVLYQEVRGEDFDRLLVEALAGGRGPDVVLLSQELILRHKDKIFALPYDNTFFTSRDFLDTFIEEGDLYLKDEGILGLPFSVDPLVMYWNRDILASRGVSQVPKSWEEFFDFIPRVTVVDDVSNIARSGIAFGEFRNVSQAKDILAMLFLQTGNPIVRQSEGIFSPTLGEKGDAVVRPIESALRFYTQFSNPAKSIYTWNRSLPESKDFFISGDLALYIGYASDYQDIRSKSPHLNFDAAVVPQAEGQNRKTTFGRMTAAAVLKASKNSATAFWAISEISGKDFVGLFSKASGLPPARRDLLVAKPADPRLSVFYDSALISRAWLDPDPEMSRSVFQSMVENVVSGRSTEADAVPRANKELISLLAPFNARVSQ